MVFEDSGQLTNGAGEQVAKFLETTSTRLTIGRPILCKGRNTLIVEDQRKHTEKRRNLAKKKDAIKAEYLIRGCRCVQIRDNNMRNT